jgi:uncharacterized protein (DUF433 family)
MIRIAQHHQRIAAHPEVMGGKPCIKGTRIPVDLIVEKLDHGQSSEEILEAYPGLTREDIRAAETYARAVPKSLLDAVVTHFDPFQVILFGSRARGEVSADSDIDLLVVLDDEAPAAKLGWRSLRGAQGLSPGGRRCAVSAALVRGQARGDRLARAHGRRGRHRGL